MTTNKEQIWIKSKSFNHLKKIFKYFGVEVNKPNNYKEHSMDYVSYDTKNGLMFRRHGNKPTGGKIIELPLEKGKEYYVKCIRNFKSLSKDSYYLLRIMNDYKYAFYNDLLVLLDDFSKIDTDNIFTMSNKTAFLRQSKPKNEQPKQIIHKDFEYMVGISNMSCPEKVHNTIEEAEAEAKRLLTIGKKAYIFKRIAVIECEKSFKKIEC